METVSSEILKRHHEVDGDGECDGKDTSEKQEVINKTIPCTLSDAANELLSLEVCRRCTSRVLGDIGFIDKSCQSLLWKFEEPCHGVTEPEICRACFGILQLTYLDEKDNVVTMIDDKELAALVFELVKKEGHYFDKYSLELYLPHIISDNEQRIRTYMKNRYGSEPWFQNECMSVKEALKFMVSTSLEGLLGVKYGLGSICIRLTYNQSIAPHNDIGMRKLECNKRHKPGNVTDQSCFEGKEDHNSSSRNFRIFGEKVAEPCRLVIGCYRSPVRFGGRYLKLSRNVSQTRWIIDDERMGEASVEEVIGNSILPACHGDDYKFHAAGREDIDVRMLGSGRPFLVEVQNPRKLLTGDAIKDMETKINAVDPKLVVVKNLRMVDIEAWRLMQEGEAEKQKQYCALVWISRSLEDEDIQSISSRIDLHINQKTPVRVLHRRSPLERVKIIHWMKIEQIAGSTQYFLLHLCTQAGTYIKEFVHGDLGRTHPSIGSILGCRAEILQLDVTDVKMDCF